MSRSEGSMSYVVFTVVFFLSALSISLFLLLALSLNMEKKRIDSQAEYAKMDMVLKKLIESYLEDESPDADSSFDSFFGDYNDIEFDGVHCTLQDISSRINLNFVDPAILLESDLQMYVSSAVNREAFIEKRQEIGLTLDLEDYSGVFLGDAWDSYFTLWGRANANIAEEEALKTLLKERGGSAMLIYQIMQEREHDYISESEYTDITGSANGELYSVLGIDPPINVNFVEEEILNVIFQALFGQDNESQYPWQNKRDSILSRRMSGEISPEDLEEILAVNDDTRAIAQYLGVQTYYWEVVLTPEEGPSERIILFTPPMTDPVVQIVRRERFMEDEDE